MRGSRRPIERLKHATPRNARRCKNRLIRNCAAAAILSGGAILMICYRGGKGDLAWVAFCSGIAGLVVSAVSNIPIIYWYVLWIGIHCAFWRVLYGPDEFFFIGLVAIALLSTPFFLGGLGKIKWGKIKWDITEWDQKTVEREKDPVALGSCPPRAPTDPNVRN